MARPLKCRRVNFFPQVAYFKPAGIPLKNLTEERLSMEELEAIRLKDVAGLEQSEGAAKMNVSRATFQRILTSARRKVAGALLEGKAIRIEGGRFEIPPCHFKCPRGHEWDVAFETVLASLPQACPDCGAVEITCSHPAGQACENRGRVRCCQIGRMGQPGDLPAETKVNK